MTGGGQVNDKLWRRIPPLGMLALAAFVICAVTGIMLVPAYKPSTPFDSLALLLLKNPTGVFVRSLHYWSAQAFFAFTLAHIVDHLLRSSEVKVRFGIWLRLGLTVPVIVASMLSGFLLRGDGAAVQALPILRTLLGFVPLIGAALPRLLTGAGSDLSTIYLHHACTATLVIWLVTVEHSRRIVPGAREVWWTLPVVLLPSLFLVPGLEWRSSEVELGPWYLVGLQELLRWLPQPRVAVWLTLAILLSLILLPKLFQPLRSRLKWTMALAVLAYTALTTVGFGFHDSGRSLRMPLKLSTAQLNFLSFRAYYPPDTSLINQVVPSIAGQREGCLACHQKVSGFSAAHDPQLIGCAACHLGNPLTLNKALAHSGMTLTPGNLSFVNQTCGTSNCHGGVADRVRGSLMNTMSGVVAVDKFVFRESIDLDSRFDVAALKHSPADTHLRNLCASCHLGQNKPHPGPIDESSRGGGCSACHLRYDPAAIADLQRPAGASALLHHPDISVDVPKQACFGCHSRSGRIATNYEGWHETLLDEASVKTMPGLPSQFRQLADGRIFTKRPADVHFEKGMTCVDCHVATEVMGDGTAHSHEGNAIKIACIDCHATGATVAVEFARLDAETQEIIALRKLNEPGREFVVSQSGSVAYPNVFLDADGRPVLAVKGSAKLLKPRPAASVCARAGSVHQRLDCGACHSAWAPQCINCHTSFDPAAQGWDHLDEKFVNGVWQEQATDYLGDAPALGVDRVRAPNGKTAEHITTFVPGMILSLELPNGRNQFHRLFAPTSPHTTVTKARDCGSCHANPVALGYGRGTLTYVVTGNTREWRFKPAFSASRQDGLPSDAWIGFLQEPANQSTTRKDARPFTLHEQQRILLVGACLECHNEKDRRLARVFEDFKNYRAALSRKCRIPVWAVD